MRPSVDSPGVILNCFESTTVEVVVTEYLVMIEDEDCIDQVMLPELRPTLHEGELMLPEQSVAPLLRIMDEVANDNSMTCSQLRFESRTRKPMDLVCNRQEYKQRLKDAAVEREAFVERLARFGDTILRTLQASRYIIDRSVSPWE